MTRGSEAIQVLKEQCRRDIERIERTKGAVGCQAHPMFADGMITLLQCQIAQMESAEHNRGAARRTAALIGTATGTAAAAIIHWLTNK